MTQRMDLIDLASTPEGGRDFVTQLHHVCNTHGLEYASYASANPVTGTVHAFTTYPDAWKTHYMAHDLHLVDPTLSAASRSIAPVDWRRLDHDHNFQNVFSQARDHNLPDTGLTIPVRGPFGEVGLFSVTVGLRRSEWDRLKAEIIGHLQTAAVHMHDSVMKSEALMPLLRYPSLSSREREILQWTAAGKSQQDIGDILSISSRTVEVHLRSSREKLSAITTAQAVGRAVSLGMIVPG